MTDSIVASSERTTSSRSADGAVRLFPGAISTSFDRDRVRAFAFRISVDDALVERVVRFLNQGLSDLAPLDYRALAIGFSGGIDSVAAIALARRSDPPVTAIIVNLGREGEAPRIARLRDHVRRLGVEYVEVDGSAARTALIGSGELGQDWLPINLDTRLIQTLIFREADRLHAAVVSTTDLSERLLGRHTECFYGQLAPLAGLYKTEVDRLIDFLGVRGAVSESRPGCEDYWFDDEALGADYDIVDPILHLMATEQWMPAEIGNAFGFGDTAWLERIQKRLKMQPLRLVERQAEVARTPMRGTPVLAEMRHVGGSDSLTPVEHLKLRLMQGGIRVTEAASRYVSERVGSRPLTLADYASTSGLSLLLEGDIWVNAPTVQDNPNFVFKPDHSLVVDGCQLAIRDSLGNSFPARLAPVPDYHDASTPQDRLFTEYVHTHTDRARISPVQGCAMHCKFCDIPYEFKGRYWSKPSAELIAALDRALTDKLQPAAHVLISGGTPAPKDYGALRQLYLDVLAAFPEVPIDIMMVPHEEILNLDELERAGVNELSLNLEIYDRDRARQIMPQKYRHGLDNYLDFIERAVAHLGLRHGHGRVRSMLMVGLEDEEMTLAGVQALVDRGCVPVLSPFRPDPSTRLANLEPPSADYLERIYLRAREICDRAGVPLGPSCKPCMHNTLTFPDPHSPQFAYGAPNVI